jgi:RNA polymerase sigma-70 factor (ECF subfamily)
MLTLTPNAATEQSGRGLGSFPSGRAEGIEWREPANFERLYRAYSRRVYSLCARMTGDASEAEELTQEVFVHLYRKLDTFRGESALYTWLYRLAVNVVLMRLRKLGRARETSLEETVSPAPNDASAYPAEIRSTDSALLGTLDRVDLQRALDALPPGFKTVFVLHDIEGYEHGEIAELTGVSVGTSKSQLHKARLRMRKLLQERQRVGMAGGRVARASSRIVGNALLAEPLPAS